MNPPRLLWLARREQANIISLHQRTLRCDAAALGRLLDRFDDPQSPLWPYRRWPRDAFDGPMRLGALGGHGATRYRLEHYRPGRTAVFRFIAPRGYHGIHGFDIQPLEDGQTCLMHFTCLRLNRYHRLMWQVLVRWVHDALLGDLLDSAELHLCGQVKARCRWKWRVYLIRHALGGARLLAHSAGLKRSNPHARH